MIKKSTAVGLGFFDGLHIGHLELIKRVKAFADANALESVVYTFSEHPNIVLGNHQNTKLLMSNRRKAELVLAQGIERVYFEHFDKTIAEMSPLQFVKDVLVERLQASHVVVGFNYNFGAKGAGNIADLIAFGKSYGFTVEVVDPVFYEEELVSSTLIRRLIEAGDMKKVARLLSRPFEIEGVVSEGKRLGSKMNFPTANIFPQENMIVPLCGVYATSVEIAEKSYLGVTNVGTNPTISSDETVIVETHLLDFNSDIYGIEILVKFIELIRPEKKFNNIEELFKQISEDAKSAREILNG